MLHSRTGVQQMENFLSTLEIEGLSGKGMKRREPEVSTCIRSVAKSSCVAALKEEICQSNNKENEHENNDRPKCTLKYDMVWQGRASGRAYNSKSGVGTLMGHQTGKVVGFDLRCKDCSFGNRRSTLSEPIPKHDCPRNWSGSSKAMEPDVGAELVGEVEEKNVRVDVMIMDDDCTTMAKIKNTVDHPVEKWSDIKHTRKQVENKLYNLQKKHKCLTSDDIQFILKCFSYAIAQNKDKPSELASAIHQIVPHVFGEHEQCNPSWCNYHSNPETYRHSTLRRDLSGDELRKDMEALFHEYEVNAEKIAPGGSTREVESFNNMITSKAPKRVHYSSTGSLRNRVSCAVAQKKHWLPLRFRG